MSSSDPVELRLGVMPFGTKGILELLGGRRLEAEFTAPRDSSGGYFKIGGVVIFFSCDEILDFREQSSVAPVIIG